MNEPQNGAVLNRLRKLFIDPARLPRDIHPLAPVIIFSLDTDEACSSRFGWNNTGTALIQCFNHFLIGCCLQLGDIISNDDELIVSSIQNILNGITETLTEALTSLLLVIYVDDRQSEWS